MSSDKNFPRKKFIADLTDDDLYSNKPHETPAVDDTPDTAKKISDTPAVDDTKNFEQPTAPTVHEEKISDTLTVDDTLEKIPEPRRKTFHSKNFTPHVEDTDTDDDSEKNSAPKVKRKISHAEISGIIISVVMLGYSLFTADKPLFFLATALLIFLLRPLIGGLFGKHNQAVQNALHGFSIALFFGAILFLFM